LLYCVIIGEGVLKCYIAHFARKTESICTEIYGKTVPTCTAVSEIPCLHNSCC